MDGPTEPSSRRRNTNPGNLKFDDEFSSFGSQFDRTDSEGRERSDREKRRRTEKLDVTRLPWHGRETLDQELGNPSCIRTRKLLELFGRDYAEVKRQIELSGTAPVGFPSDQWDNIIRCKAVNLDVILSSLHHVGAPKENVGRIGHTEISFGRSEPIRKVETAGQWQSAFNAYVKAVRFAFEHREQELRDYMEYIEGLFSSRVASAHPKVILFDKAVREEVGGGQRILLTDTNRFNRLTAAILMPDGIKGDSGRRKGKQAAERAEIADGGTSAGSAGRAPTRSPIAAEISKSDAIYGMRPKYLRYNVWDLENPSARTTADWSETATPLPYPPPRETDNTLAQRTLADHPELFKIVTPIKADVLEAMCADHPNQPFVKSVCRALRVGFWPYANTHPGTYPNTYDMSLPTPSKPEEAEFLRSQRDVEILKGRFSESFGRDLYDGMYSMPIHVVPKKSGEGLRLVTNQSAGEYSLNSMIRHSDIAGMPLDNMRHLGDILLSIRKTSQRPLILFKSDVAEAYRLIPLHPLFQLKQVVTIDGERHVDRNNAFGGRASLNNWGSVMSLVSWVAREVERILNTLVFNDDNFGVAEVDDLVPYPPYGTLLPRPQARLLELWDKLGIPHKASKQISGTPLLIIGILVDPNAMTMTLPTDKRVELVAEIRRFTYRDGRKSRHFRMKAWQRLAGWINWSFNVFPLLRPCLNNVYPRITEHADRPHARIWCNQAMRGDLDWAADHMERSSGIHLLRAQLWEPSEADFSIFCDASLTAMGFWYPCSCVRFTSDIPPGTPSDKIFFYEALCVASAILDAAESARCPCRLVIYTDNTNTVDMFNSLRALPALNPLVRAVVDALIKGDHQLRVLHIPGEENTVADLLSRGRIADAVTLVPDLQVIPFQPPRELLGAAEK
ncbi:hypothetical protein LshimejAT787_1900440 [Lyophyllum shimeji]|uniref:Uncharacterized protein n=1 Tax=Lyophyllum shimeji TaxID=47721 RepID=A0A9P3UWC2_LYOSH|nr:hypothetical protein LshimejAT787_1900440 [Lyophyllum shimeji]